MQLFDEAALVSHGRVLHVVSVTGSAAVLPHLISVSPRFLIAGNTYTAAIRTANFHPSIDAIIARANGRFHRPPLHCIARLHFEIVCQV